MSPPDGLPTEQVFFFDAAEQENTGPNYTYKFIDPYWDDEKISSVLPG